MKTTLMVLLLSLALVGCIIAPVPTPDTVNAATATAARASSMAIAAAGIVGAGCPTSRGLAFARGAWIECGAPARTNLAWRDPRAGAKPSSVSSFRI
jgi:hypothetical protein